MEFSDKIKLSADFTFTKLLCIGGSILCIERYLEKRKSQDLYTELYFLGIILFLMGFTYFFTRPKVFFDQSNLYFKKISTSERRIPLRNICSIFSNPLFMARGSSSYEIEYRDENNEIDKIKFRSESPSPAMRDFKNVVKKINSSVEID
ncbi:MAG TPA: hypothetical protein VFH08_20560 [Chitinophagaceae bacterium]|nr:hypothetical protein [Chitinophagaceae bacterium]